MDSTSLVVGLLVGGLGGIALGVAAVAFDRERLWRTLIARASAPQLRHVQQLIRDRAASLGYETSGELLATAPPER
jgi:hypothetical protein